jgi:hypothetical protein
MARSNLVGIPAQLSRGIEDAAAISSKSDEMARPISSP